MDWERIECRSMSSVLRLGSSRIGQSEHSDRASKFEPFPFSFPSRIFVAKREKIRVIKGRR